MATYLTYNGTVFVLKLADYLTLEHLGGIYLNIS
jgi:hypothetical protein